MVASVSNANDSRSGDLPNLDAAWSISEASFEYIGQLISESGYQTMVEFGSGLSTARWLMAFPELSVTSVEHDPQFFSETVLRLKQLGLSERAQVCLSPLQKYWFYGRRFHSYTKPTVPETCDIIIVDGPPSYTRRGREACLYYVYDHIRVGGVVILDDAKRPDEKAIIANWLALFPDSFECSIVEVGNCLAVLRKIKQVSCRRFAYQPFIDYARLQWQTAVFNAKVQLNHHLRRV